MGSPCPPNTWMIMTEFIDYLEKTISKIPVSWRSIMTQLLNYLHICTDVVASGCIVDSMYFDFSKPFDTVPQERLSVKMKAYGIEGKLLAWVEHFLTRKEQMVRVNGELSTSIKLITQ